MYSLLSGLSDHMMITGRRRSSFKSLNGFSTVATVHQRTVDAESAPACSGKSFGFCIKRRETKAQSIRLNFSPPNILGVFWFLPLNHLTLLL